MAVEIKTAADLNKLLEEMHNRLEAVEAKPAAPDASKDIEQLKVDQKAFQEKLGNLEIAVKARGSWKEQDTPQAKAYKLGLLVNTMIQAKHGVAKAGEDLEKLGTAPSKLKDEQSGYFEKAGVWEKTNPSVSSAPLRSDDSSTYYGSYLIPVEYSAELLRTAADVSKMMGIVRHVPMRGITKYIPNSTDELAFTAVTDQTTAKTEDHLTIGRATLTAVVYASWLAITEEMDEDSLIGLGDLIRTMYGEAWGTKFDTLALSDSTYGLFANSSVNEKVMGVGDVNFASVDFDDLDDLIAELTTEAKRQRARFFMHTTVFDYFRGKKDDMGRYLFQEAAGGAPATLRGYPFVLSDGATSASSSAASTTFIGFGNPLNIIAGDRVGFEFRIFDQTMGTMQYDQIYLRARVRQAMVVGLPASMAKLTTAAS